MGDDRPTTTDSTAAVGVLMYVERPEPLVGALCRCTQPGGIVSVMALNARTLAIQPALDRRWADALAAFDATGDRGPGPETRGDTTEGLSEPLQQHGVTAEARYGVWLFAEWMDLTPESTDIAAIAADELEASLRGPYRQLSRAFHLTGRRAPASHG